MVQFKYTGKENISQVIYEGYLSPLFHKFVSAVSLGQLQLCWFFPMLF